ncbi:hypothetical protein [Falsiroseomonas sp. HW251]|uniref:hypothetical protein n=1 Tax=Falsiroseomonas sp. HW251 TaxID=3390998 RepID=UPI003D31B61A
MPDRYVLAAEASSRSLRRVERGFMLASLASVAGCVWASLVTGGRMWFARSGATWRRSAWCWPAARS